MTGSVELLLAMPSSPLPEIVQLVACHHTDCLALPSAVYYGLNLKTLTVRLPEPMANEIEAESRARRVSKSNVVRERLARRAAGGRAPDPVAGIADLIGPVDGLPSGLSSRTQRYLKKTGYGQKRPR